MGIPLNVAQSVVLLMNVTLEATTSGVVEPEKSRLTCVSGVKPVPVIVRTASVVPRSPTGSR